MIERRIIARQRWRAFFKSVTGRLVNAAILAGVFAAVSLPMSFVSWLNEPSQFEISDASYSLNSLLNKSSLYQDISEGQQDNYLKSLSHLVMTNGNIALVDTIGNEGCDILIEKHPYIQDKQPSANVGVTCDRETNTLAVTMESAS